jgi:3',5'-cyclic AMP phosphodiesterase CpdA
VIDQAYRRLTHRKGGPARTVAWAPFPGDERPQVHLALAGDVGYRGRRVRATGATVDRLDAAERLDGLAVLGDNAYPHGDPTTLRDTVFGPFAGVLAHAKLFAVLGNHDVLRGHAGAQAEALGMEGRWWARHLDDLLLVGLDSNLADDPDQRAWLAGTLAAAAERWRVVLVHHPPFSAGYQGSDLATRRAFTPLFERHGVQLVVSGHDHDYQRSHPVGGVTYLVTGGAARTRRTGEEAFTAASFAWHHVVELASFPDRLVVRAVGGTGGRAGGRGLRVADEAIVPLQRPEAAGPARVTPNLPPDGRAGDG